MYKVTIPRPAVKPTPDEELLKLDIIELTRRSHCSVYTLLDDVKILIIKRGLERSHEASISGDCLSVVVTRINKGSIILEVNPIE